jgi:hypothetical protein
LSGAGRCARPSASKHTRTLPRHSACLADPNDEAISGHRLYGSGLGKVLWAGVVLDSVVIRALEMRNRVRPSHDPSRFRHLTHHVVLLKECVVEVVSEAVSVRRFEAQDWTPQLPPWVANRRPHIGISGPWRADRRHERAFGAEVSPLGSRPGGPGRAGYWRHG